MGDTLRPSLRVEKVWQEGKRRFVRLATRLVNQRDDVVLEGFQVYQALPAAPGPEAAGGRP